jgi:hypothetical protein
VRDAKIAWYATQAFTLGLGYSFFGNPDAVWAGEQAVGDEHLVAVVTFLGHPTVAEPQYLDTTPTP